MSDGNEAERHNDPELPITWSGWEGDQEVMVFYNVIFLEDFGVFKKGEHYADISIDRTESKLKQFDSEGKLLQEQKYKITPVG